MGKTVCVDALIYFNGAVLPERNQATIKQDVDIAEAKPFVANFASAFATKSPTWKSWTCSANGYYDDADNSIQNNIRDGVVGQVVVYPSRAKATKYWYGQATVKSCEHAINPNDYSELNVEFDGSGTVTWIGL